MRALGVVIAVGLAVPALAQEAAAPAPVQQQRIVLDVPGPSLGVPVKREKIICRRENEIGSFVKGIRRCGTASEWRKSAEAAQSMTNTLQEMKGRPGSGGCTGMTC